MSNFDMSNVALGDIQVGTATPSRFYVSDRYDPDLLIEFNAVTTFVYVSGEPVSGAIGSVRLVRANGEAGIEVHTNLPDLATALAALAPAQALASQVAWADLILQDAEPEIADATTIVIPNSDGTKTRFEGSFTFPEDQSVAGTVTAVVRLDASNNPISGQSVSFSPPADLGLLIAGLFPGSSQAWDLFASVLFGGANTISVTSDVQASDQVQVAGFGGDDTILDLAAPAPNKLLSYLLADGPVVVDLQAGTSSGADGADTFTSTSFVGVEASQFNDTLLGRNTTGTDLLYGSGGDDILTGLRGGDRLEGGEGNDTIDYSADAANGGTGKVTVYLASNIATDGFGDNDQLASIESVIGSNAAAETYNDIVFGTTATNVFDLRGGGDIAVAEAGNDVIYGGTGSDAIYGGANDDVIVGSDFVSTFTGEIDFLFGDDGNDTIYTGTLGTAYIEGGAGNDIMYGGAGTDYFLSGTDNDYMFLGGGVDLVIIRTPEPVAGQVDTIADFTNGQDFIFMTASLAGSTSFGNGSGFAYMAISVAGGTHYTIFTGATAAQIQDQVYFNL